MQLLSQLHMQVMEYADGGDLSQALKARAGKLMTEDAIIDWFVQMCLGLKHIHDKKVRACHAP
jgi:serine/threonine protein kinase